MTKDKVKDAEAQFHKAIGKRIQERQEALNLSDYALAGRSEMPIRDLLIYKRGDHGMRTPRLVALAKALSVSTDWLVGLDVSPPQ